MKREAQRLFSLAAVIVAAVLFGMVIAGGVNLTPDLRAERSAVAPEASTTSAASTGFNAPDFASLADQVVPSVVSVFSTEVQDASEMRRNMPQDPFHFFFGQPEGGEQDPEPRSRQSSGSGFFISTDGEILTNFHVIDGADKIQIQLADDTILEAEVVGRDEATDIAVLRVKDADHAFPALPLGDSDGLRVGEWVMAVGNPLNMDHSVTVGVVSAKGRALGLSDTSFEDYIQTDAAINFGNSGGPLVNTRGEVIGINTAINARAQNLGFAVPIRIAKRILPQLRENGKVVRGYLGVSVSKVDEKHMEAFGLPDRDGAFVAAVNDKSAGERAGLKPGDVIVTVDGRHIGDTRQLIDTISATPPGEKVKLGVIRDGKTIELTATLDERSVEGGIPASATGEPDEGDASERLGMTVSELTGRARQFYGVPDDVDGVVVTQVKPLSPADGEGLVKGDVITQVNGKDISNVRELIDEVDKVDAGGYLRLYVYRPRVERFFFAIPKLD
jgi:serine protease Do